MTALAANITALTSALSRIAEDVRKPAAIDQRELDAALHKFWERNRQMCIDVKATPLVYVTSTGRFMAQMPGEEWGCGGATVSEALEALGWAVEHRASEDTI